MNTPNKLTLIRVILSPFFMFFLLASVVPYNYLWAALIFAVASATDYIDGQIARKRNQITTFGKFLDPVADKVLVTCAWIGFVELQWISGWFALLMITREFLVTSLRLVATKDGTVIAANFWGKAKTVSQIVAVLIILLLKASQYGGASLGAFAADTIVLVAISVATLLSLISGGQYIWLYKEYIDYKS